MRAFPPISLPPKGFVLSRKEAGEARSHPLGIELKVVRGHSCTPLP